MLRGVPRRTWLRLWFYVGVPLVLGFLLGWWRVGRSAEWPLTVSLAYWTGVALLSTALQAAATQLLSPLFRRMRSPLWLTLLFGQLVAGAFMVMPALNGWRALLRAILYPDMPVAVQWVGFDNMLQRMPTNALLWVGLNLLFFYGLRMPDTIPPRRCPCRKRATRRHATQVGRPCPMSRFASRKPRPLFGPMSVNRRAIPPCPHSCLVCAPIAAANCWRWEADGHYLHVHTAAGTDLILYRFSDALTDLVLVEGARVHRSWWVAQRALSSERHRESLQLVNGLQVPVSRSYRLAARERAWIHLMRRC